MKLKLASLVEEEAIVLDGNKLSADDVDVLMKALKKSKRLHTLKISSNVHTSTGRKGKKKARICHRMFFDDKFANALAQSGTIETLWLQDIHIGVGTKRLTAALKLTTLKSIHLTGNKIYDDGVECLVGILAENKRLERLVLNENNITDVGAEHLARALDENSTLKHLELDGNEIGPDGTASLSECLAENETLETLVLNCNRIGDHGAEHLARAIGEKLALKRLEIGGNEIGPNGASGLELALKDPAQTLEVVVVDNNAIGDEGAASFASVLMENKRLRILDLCCNDITGGGAESLADSLPGNETLRVLKLGGNKLDNGPSIFNDALRDGAIQEIHLGRTEILYNRQEGKVPKKKLLPKTTLELSQQVRAKMDMNRIANLEAELESTKPAKIDLTRDTSETEDATGAASGPPYKRRRAGKSVEAVSQEVEEKNIQVKEELKTRARGAEEAKEAAEATLKDVREDLEDEQELVQQQSLFTDKWQGKFDELAKLAQAAGVDYRKILEIRQR